MEREKRGRERGTGGSARPCAAAHPLDLPRGRPAGTPTGTRERERKSDGKGEERQGRTHFLSLSLPCTDKQRQHRCKDRHGTQRVKRSTTADAQREKHTHAKPETRTRTRTRTRTARNNARTHTEARRATERERHTHTARARVVRGMDGWVGRRGDEKTGAQCVRSMRLRAGATTTQTCTHTCGRPLRPPTPTPSARRRRRLARGVGSMSARGRR